MIVGKNSWKGMLLLLYVAITIVASIGCFLTNIPFFIGVGLLLIGCNGYLTVKQYKALQGEE